jgi:hypothetical protein
MSINYLVNPDMIKYENEQRIESIKKFKELKLEAESGKNASIKNYNIIVINNSKNSTGIIHFMYNKNFVGKYVKIYLYKHKIGIVNIFDTLNSNTKQDNFGPIYIDSIDSFYLLIKYIIDELQKDFYVDYPEQIENYVNEYFSHDHNPKYVYFQYNMVGLD